MKKHIGKRKIENSKLNKKRSIYKSQKFIYLEALRKKQYKMYKINLKSI